MDLQTTIYVVVGLSFALYIGIAIWARAGFLTIGVRRLSRG